MLLGHESNRLSALRQYDSLDTSRDEDFDKIAEMCARLFGVGLSCITLVDKDRFVFKSAFGTDAQSIDRRSGFCDTTVQRKTVHCVEDTRVDALVHDHPLVNNDPHVRSYAGAALRTSAGYAIGTLCLMDTNPRAYTEAEKTLLQELAEFVMYHLDRRRMQAEELQREENRRNVQKLESLGMLAGGVAHDFNNLLVGILGNASLAAEQINKGSPAQETVADITRAAEQANELTNQLLAYAGQRPSSPVPVELGQLIEEMHSLLATTSKGVVFKADYPADLPPALGDPSQLRQVIVNLVANACDAYSGESGSVVLNLSCVEVGPAKSANVIRLADLDPGQYIRLEVSDAGCGMDAETLRSIFNPFFSTKVSGRGLGMSIVQRIVRGHRGHVEVESSLGKGCMVRVLIPVDMAGRTPTIADHLPARIAIQGRGTVLIVDDDETVIRMTTAALERFGFVALSATTGMDALEQITSPERIDLLLLDATMPGMSGAATLKAIRQYCPELPTVVTSGHHIDEVAATFDDFEQLTFLSKPWKIAQLSAALCAALERQKQRHAESG